MNRTRYCSTCGSLLSQEAVICGECGARYQASPYDRRATDAPGAWSRAPKPRSRDLGPEEGESAEDGVELITREDLEPKNPSATTLRSREQYDQMMVTQPPTQHNDYGSASDAPSGPGSPGLAPDAPAVARPMDPPLDGCAPATPLKRLLAALVDGVVATLMVVPMGVGLGLMVGSGTAGALSLILTGVGAALPLAYALLMIWLSGSKGFTLGKLILGLRITRGSQGGPIGFVRALGRWVLFGLVWPIMAVSIFLDPEKHLRGFHDRAVDSVVVDLKAGRDPMKPRPDDFERAGAEHYLGAPSVAVSTHENLLAEPGAAWKDSSAPAEAPSGEATGWGGAPQGAPSPYASSASGSSAASAADAPVTGSPWGAAPAQEPAAQSADSGWAPPPTDPIPSPSWDQPQSAPEAPQQASWGQPAPAPQQSWDAPVAEPAAPSWEPPAPQAPPAAPQQSWEQQQWGRPSPAPEAPQVGSAQWGPPPAAPHHEQPPAPQSGPDAPAPYGQDAPAPYGQSAPPAPAPYGLQPSAPHDQGAENPPSDLTGSAWDGGDDGVDEQTRLTVADDPLGDLEQTRISAMQLPAVKKLRLVTDDGAERIVERAVVIGRNPAAPGEEVLFVMKDDTRSVSKTHLSIDGTGDEITVTDLGSTNGSTILREDGSRENLVPNTPTVLPTGAQVTLGDRTVSVERMQ